MYKKVVLLVSILLIVAGCGRKELPKIVNYDVEEPAIIALKRVDAGSSLQLKFKLTGGSDGIGYQVDRTELDLLCNCPGFWRRDFEEPPQAKNYDRRFSKLLTLPRPEVIYLFRIRAVDAMGRLGSWSEPIKAQGDAKAYRK